MARPRTISITDCRTGKTTYQTFPAPKPGERANTMDLTEGDIFEHKGILYKVTGHDGDMCLAKELSGDPREFAFICEVVDYKGRPIYALVRDGQVVGGPFKDRQVPSAYRYPGEEVIEILPTDQGYEEFKSYL